MGDRVSGLAWMILLAGCDVDGSGTPNGNTVDSTGSGPSLIMRVSWQEGTQATPFSEAYYSDGSWKFSEDQRARFFASGSWTKDDRGIVCVTIDSTSRPHSLLGQTICRDEPAISGETVFFGKLNSPEELVEVRLES